MKKHYSHSTIEYVSDKLIFVWRAVLISLTRHCLFVRRMRSYRWGNGSSRVCWRVRGPTSAF